MNIFWLLLPTISDNKKLQSLDRPEPGGEEWSVESLTPGNTRHCVMLSRDIPEIPDTGPTPQFLTVPAPLTPHFRTRYSSERVATARRTGYWVQPWASRHCTVVLGQCTLTRREPQLSLVREFRGEGACPSERELCEDVAKVLN